jgi:hypothetical protein
MFRGTLALALAFALALGTAGTAGAADVPTGYVPVAKDVRHWIKAWCSVKPGMTPSAAIRIMGRPTDKYLRGPNPQMSWDGYQYQFNAFFGLNNRIRQLDINDFMLTRSERRSIPCETTRIAR